MAKSQDVKKDDKKKFQKSQNFTISMCIQISKKLSLKSKTSIVSNKTQLTLCHATVVTQAL